LVDAKVRVHLDDHAVVRVGIRVYGNILRIQWTQWTLEASVAFLVLRKSSKELRLRAKGTLECRLANAKFSDSNQVLARKSGFCLLQDLCDLIKVLVNWL